MDPSYYTIWEGNGLQKPDQKEGIRDWLQTVGLTKEEDYRIDPKVEVISMGLGWDRGVDVDASAALFDQNRTLVDLIWWNKLESVCKSLKHSGDNRTGEGGGDDENIIIDIHKIPLKIHYILFSVCIYSGGKSFNEVREAYVRLMNGKPKYKGHVMCRFSLTEMTGHAMLMGLMIREGAYWNFKALGEAVMGRTIQEIVQFRDNLKCLERSQSFPPKLRRVLVSVVKGENLAASDTGGLFRQTPTSDPYYTLKFRKNFFKSQVKKKTLNPEWKETNFDMGFLTEAEPKALKIVVYDYDAVSEDDFLGMVRIPACALYNAQLGSSTLWFVLGPSKEPKWAKATVSGRIMLSIAVMEI